LKRERKREKERKRERVLERVECADMSILLLVLLLGANAQGSGRPQAEL